MKFFSKHKYRGDDELRQARHNMVERQIAGRDVSNPAVLNALRKVPRHLFVPNHLLKEAYNDTPLPIGCGQTISQPYIVGSMTEIIYRKESCYHVYEIGTGSGYQTAVLAELFEHVTTVEYFAELSSRAQAVLKRIGYDNITFHVGDGLQIVNDDDLFESIIITAAPPTFPDELAAHLKPEGRMVVPVGEISQVSRLAEKDRAGNLDISTLYSVRFVRLQSGG